MAEIVSLAEWLTDKGSSRRRGGRKKGRPLHFTRPELSRLIQLYSREVARGQWRDYAMDFTEEMAVFSIFRHSWESPVFSIVKHRGQSGKPPRWSVFSGRQQILKSDNLASLLMEFEDKIPRRSASEALI